MVPGNTAKLGSLLIGKAGDVLMELDGWFQGTRPRFSIYIGKAGEVLVKLDVREWSMEYSRTMFSMIIGMARDVLEELNGCFQGIRQKLVLYQSRRKTSL